MIGEYRKREQRIEWRRYHYSELLAHGLVVLDAAGRRVTAVHSAEPVMGGVEVRVLHPAEYGEQRNVPCLAHTRRGELLPYDVVQFVGFIRGGSIVRATLHTCGQAADKYCAACKA